MHVGVQFGIIGQTRYLLISPSFKSRDSSWFTVYPPSEEGVMLPYVSRGMSDDITGAISAYLDPIMKAALESEYFGAEEILIDVEEMSRRIRILPRGPDDRF